MHQNMHAIKHVLKHVEDGIELKETPMNRSTTTLNSIWILRQVSHRKEESMRRRHATLEQ